MHQMIYAGFTAHLWMINLMTLKSARSLQEETENVWQKLLLREPK